MERVFSPKGRGAEGIHNIGKSPVLLKAIERHDLKEVQRLLREGVDPNELDDETGQYPLYLAIEKNAKPDIALCLVKYGADVKNRKTEFLAHEHAEHHGRKKLAEFLKKRFFASLTTAERKNLALYSAAKDGDLAKVKLAIKNGADIDSLEINQHSRQTALSVALLGDHQDVAQHLIENNAATNFVLPSEEPTRLTEYYITGQCNVVHWWACRNDVGVLEFLANNKVDLNQRDSMGCTPFYIAARYCSKNAARFLLKNGADSQVKNVLRCSAEAFGRSLDIKGRIRPLSNDEKRFVERFTEGDLPNRRDFAKLKSSEALHSLAGHFNWDGGVRVMHWVVESKLCDKATAMMIYWLANPGHFYSDRYSSHQDLATDETFQLIKKIEENVRRGFYKKENIFYDPQSTHIGQVERENVFTDPTVRAKIPDFMLEPQVGQIWKIE